MEELHSSAASIAVDMYACTKVTDATQPRVNNKSTATVHARHNDPIAIRHRFGTPGTIGIRRPGSLWALRGSRRETGDAGNCARHRGRRTMAGAASGLCEGLFVQLDIADAIQRTELEIHIRRCGCRNRCAGFDEMYVHTRRKTVAVARQNGVGIRDQTALERSVCIGERHDLADSPDRSCRFERHTSSRNRECRNLMRDTTSMSTIMRRRGYPTSHDSDPGSSRWCTSWNLSPSR